MAAEDENSLFSNRILVENKDMFVDVKKNDQGVYLKITERNRSNRSTIMIPASGIASLRDTLTAALAAIEGINTSAPRDRRGASGESKESEPTKVFITSLAWDVTDADMAAFFNAHCGADSVVKAEVLMKRGGRSLGSGIVEFRTAEQAQTALSLGGQSIGSRAIAVRPYFKNR